MKKIYVNEASCLGCHLCEYYCASANLGGDGTPAGMAKVLMGVKINPRIQVEGDQKVSFAVSCRHCTDPLCVKSCIAGALAKADGGMVEINRDKCVGCYTCVLVCPYGAIMPGEDGAMQKCELCVKNAAGEPACVSGCPNRAIVYEERGAE